MCYKMYIVISFVVKRANFLIFLFLSDQAELCK